MTQPTRGSNPSFSYPTRTKLVVALVVTLAIGGFVLAGVSTDTDIDDDIAVTGTGGGAAAQPGDQPSDQPGQTRRDPDGVVDVEPGDGTQALSQEAIRIRLSAGWAGELTLLPSAGSAITIPMDQVKVTALNELVFVPAEGKVVQRLPSGTNCVRATIWDQVEGRASTERLHSWCFDVT